MKAVTPRQFLENHLGVDVDDIEIDPDLKEIQGSAREIPEEEKEKRREELEDMSTSDLEEVFGLD